jgi:hypothetical protein
MEQGHEIITKLLVEADKAHIKTMDDPPPTDSGYVSMSKIIEDTQGQCTDLDDVQTVYSESSDVPVSVKEEYISRLAENLLAEVRHGQPDGEIMERTYQVLPTLLKAFALRLGHGTQDLNHRNIMIFVHKHRRYVLSAYIMSPYSLNIKS